LGNVYLIGPGEMLDAGSDVDGLAEIVEALVQRDGDRRALVDTDLQDQLAIRLAVVEFGDVRAHRQGGGYGVGRVQEGRHHGVTDGLDNSTPKAGGDVLQT